MDSQRSRMYGFTLVELLVVLAILGLLAGVVGPQVMKFLDSSKSKTAKLQVDSLAATLDLYRLEVGRYPSTSEGLEALVRNTADLDTWNGPYLTKGEVPTDPWGNPYHYRFPGEHGGFDLWTFGADNREGGEGESADLHSWD
ncbi:MULTISPECIES: type II secretion system major pseudopilin GspG [Marichromatium]|uniref:Type II secretion system core protein G n=1 Tax=Marichromatium gracile TaxID=1048 RepID=A0A4R4AKG1_MARGR|nr:MULTISPECIES: type II secretion system major pseudopilin GspG [Marichromatium]MBK1707557.1 type II secretion system protein GspG [Marichromatium gracile]MBO8085197.1 type II secretion system major pseudopilin GspG [Marichromatium sp.]RNE91973.1 type II secretion system protein GspG [Marichromatium sp. AB31]TCW39907.1 general secretion pathway protein G [Marichromatium gracile]